MRRSLGDDMDATTSVAIDGLGFRDSGFVDRCSGRIMVMSKGGDRCGAFGRLFVVIHIG